MDLFFFDLDRTLVKTNITKKFLIRYISRYPKFFLKLVFFNLSLFKNYFLRPKDLEICHQLVLKILQDNYYQIFDFSKNYSVELFKNELFIPAVEELLRAQHTGKIVVLLSAAPEFIVDPIAKFLNLEHVYCTRYYRDENGKLKIHTLLTGVKKAGIAKKYLEKYKKTINQATAFSDSIEDLELLCSVGLPVVVNPDNKLKKIAKEENWRILF